MGDENDNKNQIFQSFPNSIISPLIAWSFYLEGSENDNKNEIVRPLYHSNILPFTAWSFLPDDNHKPDTQRNLPRIRQFTQFTRSTLNPADPWEVKTTQKLNSSNYSSFHVFYCFYFHVLRQLPDVTHTNTEIHKTFPNSLIPLFLAENFHTHGKQK